MFHLVYVSSAVNLFSEEQLAELLEISRVNNTKCGLTGILLYLDGNFIQVLEGEKDAVLGTSARISRDPRHRGILTLLQGDITERDFPEWSMAYRRLDPATSSNLPGYSDFIRQKASSDRQIPAAFRLLDNFKSINR